jgi:hypothetical protein
VREDGDWVSRRLEKIFSQDQEVEGIVVRNQG